MTSVNTKMSSDHDQLQRALSELKAYQTKYPPIFSTTNDPTKTTTTNGPSSSSVLWETTAEIMNPLLRSYDARIYELENIATQQAIQLDELRSQQQLISTTTGDPSLEALKEDLVHDLGERMEVLLAENALLTEQKRVLSEELDSFQHDLDQRTQQLDEGTQQLLATEPKLAHLQNALQQTEQDRDSAASKAISYSEALGKTQARLEVALSELNALRSHSVDLEKLYKQEQLDFHKYKFDMDRETLESMHLAQRAEERSNDLKSQLSSKAEELESTQETLRKLRREYQSTRQDAEGMVQVIGGLERQVSEFTATEVQNKAMLKQWQERMEEALFLRDQAEGKAEALAVELSRLVEQRKLLALSREVGINE